MARTRVRWGRLGATAATVALTVSFLAGRAGAGSSGSIGSTGSAGFTGSRHALAHRTYVVQAGDTLWGIASRLVGPHADPRPTVDRLARSNRVEAGVIHVGDVLVVPAA
jgi:nucleoid-associated protein YgaU